MSGDNPDIWLVVGSIKHWRFGLKNGVWGATEGMRSMWGDDPRKGDVFFFYVSAPVKGVVGYGVFEGMGLKKEDKLIWEEEKEEGRSIYKHTLYFSNLRSIVGPDAPDGEWIEKCIGLDQCRGLVNRAFTRVRKLECIEELKRCREHVDALKDAFTLDKPNYVLLNDILEKPIVSKRAEVDFLGDILKKESEEVVSRVKLVLAHVVAGKNVVFYGPPGTGKTRLAILVCKLVCGDDGYSLETANSEWGHYDVIGGYRPAAEGVEWVDGILTRAVKRCRERLDRFGRPYWLIIDELNRANLDLAFGEAFTLLDVEYRDKPLSIPGESVFVPYCFRIVATMNVYDRSLLFSLGYAFMRRFAFIEVPSLLRFETVSGSQPGEVKIEDVGGERLEEAEKLKEVIRESVVRQMKLKRGNDFAVVFRELAEKDIRRELEDCLKKVRVGDFDFLDVLLMFARKATDLNVVEIGQAMLIDAAKFILAYYMLFPEDVGVWLVDEAVVAYILPQFEFFMPQLRRAKVFEEKEYEERWKKLIGLASKLGLVKTAGLLETAEARLRMI
ncbi:MAG TPA: hypothetical protein ENG66_06130 [Thermococcus sp.]|nr:hypothetical protein [Thermococcus sp.]